MNILLGVTGGIAAYKSCDFCSQAVKRGHSIRVIQTRHAQHFIGPITFEGLTGHPVYTDTFDNAMDHIELGRWANVFVVAPLTANSLAKIAHGLCDDLLSTTICATPLSTPILLCPAMNTHMWTAPMTQRNLELVQSTQRYHFEMPVSKRLACGDVGVGGLADPATILTTCESLCSNS